MNEQKPIYNPVSLIFHLYGWMIPVCAVPSITVMLFLRTKLGYRFVNSILVGLGVLSFVFFGSLGGLLGGSAEVSLSARYGAQAVFILLVIGLAAYHRHRGWHLIFDRDLPWHTQSRGLSWLSRILPINGFVIQRYIEPALCVLVGLAFIKLGLAFLGFWLIFAGFSLAALEQLVFEQQLNAMLDRYDARVSAQEIRREDEMLRSGDSPRRVRLEETNGFIAHVSPEVEMLLMETKPIPAMAATLAVPAG